MVALFYKITLIHNHYHRPALRISCLMYYFKK
jgi:hypothetical protein